MGCSLCRFTAAASRSTSLAGTPSSATTSVTTGLPCVSVPVLSNATLRTDASRSRCAPPLMSTPRRAPAASADTMATGVAMTSAHGQAMTSSTSARYSHTDHSSPPANGGTIATTAASAMTAGV